MKFKNISFVVGRFQPFHNGHKLLIDEALSKSPFGITIVFIGSSTEPETENNPFNFYKRVDMISKTYGVRNDMIICPLPDFATDKEWVNHIRQVVYDFAFDDSIINCVVNDKDVDTNDLLRTIDRCTVHNYNDREYNEISCTKIREMLKNKVNIHEIDDIPYGTKSVLQEYC